MTNVKDEQSDLQGQPELTEQPLPGMQPEQQLTPEQLQQLVYDNLVAELVEGLGQFTNFGEEIRVAHAHAIAKEQFDINAMIIPSLVDPNQLRDYPTVVITLTGPNGVKGNLQAPKNMVGYNDPGLALYSAFMLSLLSCPLARALLRINGFSYVFAQSKTPVAEKGKIIM